MRRTTGLALILIAVATAAAPAFARHYRYHDYYGWNRGAYNYGGPHYNTDDYTNNSRELVGTR